VQFDDRPAAKQSFQGRLVLVYQQGHYNLTIPRIRAILDERNVSVANMFVVIESPLTL